MLFLILDFSDEIANLTLLERPNTLYKDHRSWGDLYDEQEYESSEVEEDDEEEEEEEVDSDSGYSSPHHRKNLGLSTSDHQHTTSSKHLPYHPPNSLNVTTAVPVAGPSVVTSSSTITAPPAMNFQFPSSAAAATPTTQIRPHSIALSPYQVGQFQGASPHHPTVVQSFPMGLGAAPTQFIPIPSSTVHPLQPPPRPMWNGVDSSSSGLNVNAVEFTYKGPTIPLASQYTDFASIEEFPDLSAPVKREKTYPNRIPIMTVSNENNSVIHCNIVSQANYLNE